MSDSEEDRRISLMWREVMLLGELGTRGEAGSLVAIEPDPVLYRTASIGLNLNFV